MRRNNLLKNTKKGNYMEQKQIKKNSMITAQEEDFAKWYTDVCLKCELMDYTSTKGFIVYRPYGYAIWENIKNYLDAEFKKTGHENVYMPCLIPEHLLTKEKEHVQGFAPECAVVTIGGNKELEERLYVRPTSETLFCEHFKDILHSYNDLPIKYNQWCSVVRWEKTTKPFLRGAEFLWQEGHTLHRTANEAREEALNMLKIYNKLGEEALCFPFVMGRKTDKEKFAGAVETYSIEALMKDGQALQSGTTHFFGDGFAKHYDIKYLDSDNTLKVPFQTSWGVSTRLIGALIMVHGDDNGLVLPPKVAPIQVAIIPIKANASKDVLLTCNSICSKLKEAGIRAIVDTSDKTPGYKFNHYEMKGVPLRIDVGPKDVENNNYAVTTRFDSVKQIKSLNDDVVKTIKEEFERIEKGMYDKAKKFVDDHIFECKTEEELADVLVNSKGYAKIMWDGTRETEDLIKEKYNATARCMPFNQIPFAENDPVSGKKAKYVTLFARAY